MRVMMSAAGSAVAPSIIRHLQSLGHYVIGHDCCEYGYGASACDEFHKSPKTSDTTYFHFLAKFVGRAELYLPFLDEELNKFANAAPRALRMISSPREALQTFTSKRYQQSALAYAGLPIAPIAKDNEWCIFKPDLGRGGKGIFFARAIDLPDYLKEDHVRQRIIDGDEYTVDVLTDLDGNYLRAVPRLRIQANGVSVIGKIVMDEELISLAKQVVSSFKFAGPINIQMIRNEAMTYIIEVNPRLSGSCMFTVMAGFDILDATIRLWEGKPFVTPSKIEDGLIIRRHYVEERL